MFNHTMMSKILNRTWCFLRMTFLFSKWALLFASQITFYVSTLTSAFFSMFSPLPANMSIHLVMLPSARLASSQINQFINSMEASAIIHLT